ncbi:PREDICTED: uncharacterized protein LOC106100339 [Papilio polytes]|uniref:uncharacterized protein LOC106100339 n=1 Tax=Papilio polytes TaxID=76194 RepID=UPI000676167B|nr:PREDICTED: uncharacterized protein LOC106100339 [Papilio polytes]
MTFKLIPSESSDTRSSLDVDGVAELSEEPSNGKKFCLLPDYEKDIFETDKSEAVKDIAETWNQAEAASELLQERKPKRKTEAEVEKENDNTEEAVDAEFEAKYEQNDAHQEKGDK